MCVASAQFLHLCDLCYISLVFNACPAGLVALCRGVRMNGCLAARKQDKQGPNSKSLKRLSKSLVEQQKIDDQKLQSAFKLLPKSYYKNAKVTSKMQKFVILLQLCS